MDKAITTSGKFFRRIYRLGYQQLVCYSRLFYAQRWNGLGMKLATDIHVVPKLNEWMNMYTPDLWLLGLHKDGCIFTKGVRKFVVQHISFVTQGKYNALKNGFVLQHLPYIILLMYEK